MNTPTPEPQSPEVLAAEQLCEALGDLVALRVDYVANIITKHFSAERAKSRQLEQELSDARKESAYHQQAYDTASAERDTLKRERDEAKKTCVEIDLSHRQLERERDQLRKFAQSWLDGSSDAVLHNLWHKEIKDAIEQRKSK